MHETDHQENTLPTPTALAFTHYEEGKRLWTKRNYEPALAALEQAISLDPSFAPAYDGRGIVLASLRRYEEALVSFDQAVQLFPTGVSFSLNKASALLRLKRYDEAAKVLEQALQFNPINRDIPIYQSKLKSYRVGRISGKLWSIYMIMVILAAGSTIVWFSFHDSPLFATLVALFTIGGALTLFLRAFRS